MTPFSLNINGRLIEYTRPAVMGILNVTPDSFYAGSRAENHNAIVAKTKKMISEGADMIDIGAYSTRPGHSEVSPEEELDRLACGLKAIREVSDEIIVSVDTFRADIARTAVTELSANIINDVSGGDDDMYQVVADLHVPYVITHVGNGNDAQNDHLVATVLKELADTCAKLSLMGVADMIIDPGFGFGKTLEQNYQLLSDLHLFSIMHVPLLVGVSRKSMITKLLNTTAEDALIGTTTIDTIALQRGAGILRVHDVAAAVQAVKIYTQLSQFSAK